MPTDVEQLQTIRSQTLQLLVDLTAQPKPSYQIDGQEVSWESYLRQLQSTLAWIDQQLAANEPFEIETRGAT